MLGSPIEEVCKIDSGKRFEKFIFRIIETSSGLQNKLNFNKNKDIKRRRSVKKLEKIKENLPKERKNINRLRKYSNRKNLRNMKEDYLYELISVSKDRILLQKKKLRQVKYVFKNQNNKEIFPEAEAKWEENIEKDKKITRNRKPASNQNNILDFDKILEEVFEHKFTDEEVSNLALLSSTKNWNKIEIETNILIKGN